MQMPTKVTKLLERAIFKFAVGGQAVVIADTEVEKIVEVGVAALKSTTPMSTVLDEPIIIEAGLNFLSLETVALDNMMAQERDGHGTAFEKIILPAIQQRLHNILKSQLGKSFEDVLQGGYSVPTRSSYGVLAIECSGISQTLDWIEKSTKPAFEGAVAPFCFPDTAIGPDLIFLMWNEEFTNFIAVISQVKYRKNVDQMDALRSITPGLLDHENRGKASEALSTTLKKNQELLKRWEWVKPKLLGQESEPGCIRFMVQYPSYQTTSADPGMVADDSPTVINGNTKKRKRGWLATVSQTNAGTLLNNKLLRVFNALKEDSTTVPIPHKRGGGGG